MKVLKYNFNDLYNISDQFKTKQYGVVQLLNYIYDKDWSKFQMRSRKILLNSSRWCNYICNPYVFLNTRSLTIMDKALIIKIASFRDISNYTLYDDKSIRLERIEDIPLKRINRLIPFIEIVNDRLLFTFENK